MANETKDKIIKIVALLNGSCLISEIEEVGATVPGEPDCKLTHPYVIQSTDRSPGNPRGEELIPFLMTITSDETFMISSDKILTLCEPVPALVDKYSNVVYGTPITVGPVDLRE